MFWSQITIPGKPRILMVDASRDAHGWEAEFCDRVFNVLSRKKIEIADGKLLRVHSPQDLGVALQLLAYLEERSGTEFDGEIAHAFTQMMYTWEPQLAVLEEDEPIPVA